MQPAQVARRKIIEAARDLFVERGYHHTSVDDVATKAGVSRATCYYQFKSKPGLLDAVIADVQERAPVTLRSHIRHPATLDRPIDNIRLLIADICLIWEVDRPLMGKVMALGEVDPEVKEVSEEREQERSLAIDAISHRLMAPLSKTGHGRGSLGADRLLGFDAIRRYASFDDTVEMLTGMAVTVVDPDELWALEKKTGLENSV